MAISGVLRLIRRFVDADAQPRGVFFTYHKPSYRAEYKRVFGGVERFGHEYTGIDFERAWLERTQLHKNPELYAILQAEAERVIGRLTRGDNIARIVKKQLAGCDPRHRLTMEDIARRLGISARTLRRRLTVEGVDYNDLVKRTRIEMAKRMLENPHMSIQETAYTMGYGTPGAFHHAFKRWTGMTPKEYKSSY